MAGVQGPGLLSPPTSPGPFCDTYCALGRQEVLVAAMGKIPPDELLAPAVVDRGVDQADSPVEYGVEDPARVLVVNCRSPRPASQFHGAVAEDGHVCSGPPQRARLDGHDRTLSTGGKR